jgi:HPt (histidine-containing phosphotransfer) domain-containing protein
MSVSTTTTNPQNASTAKTSELNGIYDLDALVDRCMGDASLAAKLLDRFGERLPITVAEVERALAAGDRSELLRQAHTLKGEAGSLAAVRLQKAAAELEACVRDVQDLKDPQIVSLGRALTAAANQCRQRWPHAIDALTTSANHA